MFGDDNEPTKKPPYQLGQDLADLSVDDLETLVDDLTTEIERIKADMRAKQASKSAADSLFKTGRST